MITRSKSSPPSEVSPWVASTSNTPFSIARIEMSNVPPPRSNTASRWLCWCWTPYASAAAVGSLRIARTVRPAIAPASLVAWRWTSSKYAGTVTTASVTASPR